MKKASFLAFSLVEILVALIIVSLITAALAPVITKKLSSSGITILGGGSGGSGGRNSESTTNPSGCGLGAYMPTGETVCRACTQVTSNCEACADGEGVCTKCNNEYTLTTDKKCKKNDPCGDKAMKISINGEDYCVTKYNVGNATSNPLEIPIPSNSATVVQVKTSCSGKCCWYGVTSVNCTDDGNYSGCNRTVCNWDAASNICDNLVYNGFDDWRLLTNNEYASLDLKALTKDKGADGLMMCENADTTDITKCAGRYNVCYGASQNICEPYAHWTTVYPYRSYLEGGQKSSNSDYNYAESVRCIRKIKPNEGATACEPGSFLSGSTCIPCSNKTTNCKTCNNSNGACTACADGYELEGNKCVWTGCGEKALKVNISGTNYCLLKYNMGNPATNSAEVPAPSGVVTMNKAGTSAQGATSCSGKCCFYGNTSLDCDGSNKNYNACTRTVCFWDAGSTLCDNLVYNGYDDWRLPTKNELANLNLAQLSQEKGSDGLMFCSRNANNNMPQCSRDGLCLGSYANQCEPFSIWSSTRLNRTHFTTGEVQVSDGSDHYASTTRCIRKMNGTESSSQCGLGYYQKTAGTCEACASKTPHCKTCNTQNGTCLICEDGYQLNGDSCVLSGCGAKALRVTIAGEDYCVTKYNLGKIATNEKEIPIPESGINVVTAGTSCSGKCCWYGQTSDTCDKYDKSYNACTRTVCNHSGASAACANLIYNGHSDWELLSLEQYRALDFRALSIQKGTEGLMPCSRDANTDISQCEVSTRCTGAYANTCEPFDHWTKSYPNRMYMQNGTQNYSNGAQDYACSVRCIRKIGADEVATQCPIGTYMDGADCVACSSKTTYCKSCNASTGACTTCEDGYELTGSGTCEWTGCGTKAIKVIIDNEPYCFTKYNVGNTTFNELEIPYPTNAGINMVKAGTSAEGVSSCSGKCCWWGTTSASCDATTEYPACTRTVCNFDGAKAACENLDYMGYTDWTLPTVNQFASLDLFELTAGKGSAGLMLCDNSQNSGISACPATARCLGAYSNTCEPFDHWSNVYPNRTYMGGGVQRTSNGSQNYANSVRCIRKLI